MKKFIAISMLIGLLLSLAACAANKPAVPETTAPTAPPKVKTNVAQPLTMADIQSIPVANDSMTEEQLRQICLDYMRLQLTFCFTPNNGILFQNGSTEKPLNYGDVYAGLPYISNCKGNLYKLMEYYDSDNGMLDVSDEKTISIIGNQCSSATYWAWARVANTAIHRDTLTSTKANGCLPVGPYTYDENIKKFDTTPTTHICSQNGEQTMFQSYALLKPADGVVSFTTSGHVRMVSSVPNIVYTESGTIDGVQSTLTYMDQAAAWSVGTQPDGSKCEIQGGVDMVITFQELYNTGYLPFTFAELNKENPVEPCTVSYSYTGDTIRLIQIHESIVIANYPISHVRLAIADADGNACYKVLLYVNGAFASTQQLYLTNYWQELEPFVDGTHTVTLDAFISNGESFPLFSGTLLR